MILLTIVLFFVFLLQIKFTEMKLQNPTRCFHCSLLMLDWSLRSRWYDDICTDPGESIFRWFRHRCVVYDNLHGWWKWNIKRSLQVFCISDHSWFRFLVTYLKYSHSSCFTWRSVLCQRNAYSDQFRYDQWLKISILSLANYQFILDLLHITTRGYRTSAST